MTQHWTRNATRAIVLAVATVAATSCGSDDNGSSSDATTVSADSTASTSATPAPTESETTMPSNTSGMPANSSGEIDPGLQPYIDRSVADLAGRLGIDPSEIVVRSAVIKTWPDGSLGCPQPGRQYAQVLTDGSLIVLAVADKTYRYHSGGASGPFLCEPGGKAPSTTG